MQSESVEWLIRKESDRIAQTIKFEDMYNIKDQIVDIVALWSFNAYRLDLQRREFIINGGRRLQLPQWKKYKSVSLKYARRTSVEVATNNPMNVLNKTITYLIGMQAFKKKKIIDEIFIQISNDGKSWKWLQSR